MPVVPKQLVNVLISQARGLSPAKLLPALVSVDDDQVSVCYGHTHVDVFV